ncbi:MAG: N-(5'-phosphoribosyl)anthranilate isomerase [Gammaproteobacteria bacterium]|nr:N-(5'-phosphoribosyl)anthranilate isomerase [Gammaproteobacteria bacterium]
MNRTRVKFCGITRREDALVAAQLGADAIGLVFHAASPRAVTIAQARDVVAVLPPFVSTVALFVNPAAELVRAVADAIRPSLLQFHGEEPPAQCGKFRIPYIKAVRVRPGIDLLAETERYGNAAAILFDSYQEDRHGGTGATFDWSLLPAAASRPFILAGGLTPDNVAAAVARVRPYAVDVSGGIEISKGIKDLTKMQAFLREVHRGST